MFIMTKQSEAKQVVERSRSRYETRILSYLAEKHDVSLDELVRDTKMSKAETVVVLNDLEHAGKIHSDVVKDETYEGARRKGTYPFVRRFNLAANTNAFQDH